jgi:hypothetical protein
MPVWLELLVLLLTTYMAGIGIGWAIWGRNLAQLEPRATKENAR